MIFEEKEIVLKNGQTAIRHTIRKIRTRKRSLTI